MSKLRTAIVSPEPLGVESSVIDLIKPSLSTIGGGSGSNWLSNLPLGSRFLFRPRQRRSEDIGAQSAEVFHKYSTCTCLFDGLNKPVYFIVDSAGFSEMMQCVEMLAPRPTVTEEGAVNVLEQPADRTD